jgi:hypothetical protein
LAVVTAGTVGWALVAAAVVVAAGLVVITAGAVVADVVVVVVAVPHPVTIKAMTNRTASAMNNLFTSYFLHYLFILKGAIQHSGPIHQKTRISNPLISSERNYYWAKLEISIT